MLKEWCGEKGEEREREKKKVFWLGRRTPEMTVRHVLGKKIEPCAVSAWTGDDSPPKSPPTAGSGLGDPPGPKKSGSARSPGVTGGQGSKLAFHPSWHGARARVCGTVHPLLAIGKTDAKWSGQVFPISPSPSLQTPSEWSNCFSSIYHYPTNVAGVNSAMGCPNARKVLEW